MILLKHLSFMLPLFLLFACTSEKRALPFCTASTTIDYSTCSASNGCTLSFSCSLHTQSVKFFDLPSKIVGNLLVKKSNPKMTSTSTSRMKIASITINQPSLLQATPGEAPTNWYNNPIDCTNDKGSVTCANFLPIANDFTIKGTLNNQKVTVNVTIDNTNILIAPACGAVVCGQTGTTVQSMFDCSQRVANFAGIGNGNNIVNPFVPGNPDPNWFLVSSPSATDNLQQQCFWLSPVMNISNPAAGANQFDSNGVAMSTYASSTTTMGRFLWSGMSTTFYNFFQANGYNPTGTTPASYNYYSFVDVDVMANAGSPGPIIYRPQNSSTIPTLTPIICAGTSDPCYDQVGGSNSFYSLYSDVVVADQSQSPCTTNTVAGINLFSGTAYTWQMPSYPMMMTLTGGVGTSCEDPPSTAGTYQAYCNGGVNGVGFNAQDPLPNFSNGSMFFWSSSISDASGAWYFDNNGGGVQNALPFDLTPMEFFTTIRCVSPTW